MRCVLSQIRDYSDIDVGICLGILYLFTDTDTIVQLIPN